LAFSTFSTSSTSFATYSIFLLFTLISVLADSILASFTLTLSSASAIFLTLLALILPETFSEATSSPSVAFLASSSFFSVSITLAFSSILALAVSIFS